MQTTFKINNSIGGKEVHNNANTTFKLIYPQQLVKAFQNNYIVIPTFQRPIDDTKVEEIKNNILNSNDWLIQQGFFTIANINDYNNKYYLLDGQHRYKAIESIINSNTPYSNQIFIMFIKFNNIEQMKEHFRTININTLIEPIYTYFSDEDVKCTILKVREKIVDQYKDAFRKLKNKSVSTHNLHIEEFMNLFEPNMVKKLYDDNNQEYTDYNYLLRQIMRANFEAQRILHDLQIQNTRKFYMSDKDYDKCNEYIFYLAFDMIDIRKFIFEDDDIIINPVYRPKTTITKKMRKEVWMKRNQTSMLGKCFCCNTNIELDNFQCGHIVAEVRGGQTILSNLEPICAGCNLGMKTHNLNDYRNTLIAFNS